MLKISIIIPCFEAEKCIKQCIESLNKQTIDKGFFEIICIDDGSTDKTYEELIKQQRIHHDLNMSIIKLDRNMGPSYARNVGIKMAKGQFLNFLDVDDVQTEDAYEKLIEPLNEKNFDVIIGKHIRDVNPNKLILNNSIDRDDQCYFFEKENGFYWTEFSTVGNNGDFFTLGASLISRKIVLDNGIFFPEEYRINEDDYWFTVLGLFISSIYVVDWVIHIYVITPNSLMTTGSDRLLERLSLYEKLLKEMIKRGVYESMYPRILDYYLHRYVLSSFYVFIMRMDVLPPLSVFNDVILWYKHYFPDWYTEYNKNNVSHEDKRVCDIIADICKRNAQISLVDIVKIKNIYCGLP